MATTVTRSTADRMTEQWFLAELGIEPENPGACTGPDGWRDAHGRESLTSFDPSTEHAIGRVALADEGDYEAVLEQAAAAFEEWRRWPAPKRGVLVRDFADALRAKKEALGHLVSLEMGKILEEGRGEVQEMIDIADFARQDDPI